LTRIWRPLNAVVDAPLAICDPVSVKQEDLLRVSRVTPEFTGENFYLKYNPQQTYYFFSNQKPDELTLFSSFNSDFPEKSEASPFYTCTNFRANRFCLVVPHAAFIHKQVDVSLGEAPRESIECRAIVMKRKE
jgi:hypothetical protein